MEDKYIRLLLERCLGLDGKRSLFISYDKINIKFVDKLCKYAKKLGVKDIYLDENDIYYIHDFLKNNTKREIRDSKLFNSAIWDDYAKKDAAFLMLSTEVPTLMDDVSKTLVAYAFNQRQITKPIYKEKQIKSLIPWCIAILPNNEWAKYLFPDESKPIDYFWNLLGKICKLDKDDPIEEWDKHLEKQQKIIQKLNELKIKTLHYQNSLGTDLKIELIENSKWCSGSNGAFIANMPSYEIFTTPNYKKTEGIVYNALPLIYNGIKIDKFYLKFKDGKVIDYHAEEGNDTLKEIIETDKYTSYLGECAIVDCNSPIAKLNLVFNTTLIDENASSHLALGDGFLECLEDGENMNKKKAQKMGVNNSKNHVDFMIGTKDLTIEAETEKGKINIMEKGKITIQ